MPVFSDPEKIENELHRLLLRAVPENSHKNKTISHLAELIPCTRWSVQKWIINKKLSPERVVRIVEIGRIGVPKDEPGRVSREDFEPFVYNV